ncbi:hypothetical protein FQZ97_1042910 [compost metagenome]
MAVTRALGCTAWAAEMSMQVRSPVKLTACCRLRGSRRAPSKPSTRFFSPPAALSTESMALASRSWAAE